MREGDSFVLLSWSEPLGWERGKCMRKPEPSCIKLSSVRNPRRFSSITSLLKAKVSLNFLRLDLRQILMFHDEIKGNLDEKCFMQLGPRNSCGRL